MGVTGSSLDLEDSLLDGEEGDIKGPATQIENKNVLLFTLLVEAVRNSGGGGLVNNTKYIESGNTSGILGSLTLRVVEVSRHGDNRVLDLLSKVSLGNLPHLSEYHGGDLLSLEGLGLSLVLDLNERRHCHRRLRHRCRRRRRHPFHCPPLSSRCPLSRHF